VKFGVRGPVTALVLRLTLSRGLAKAVPGHRTPKLSSVSALSSEIWSAVTCHRFGPLLRF
jgi:hypothetical protein